MCSSVSDITVTITERERVLLSNGMVNVLERRRKEFFRKQLHASSLLLFKN